MLSRKIECRSDICSTSSSVLPGISRSSWSMGISTSVRKKRNVRRVWSSSAPTERHLVISCSLRLLAILVRTRPNDEWNSCPSPSCSEKARRTVETSFSLPVRST